MSKEHIATADTVEEATALALAELGVVESDAIIEILEEPGKKLFGGRKSAVVKAVRALAGDTPPAAEAVVAESGPANEVSDDYGNENQLRIEDLSDEQVDEIADIGIEHLKKLVSFLSEGGISIEEFEGDEGEIILDVTGEDVGVLIGRHGRTIDALQSIVSLMTARQAGVRYPLSVDVEGYKHRRKQKIVDIARRAADRAKRTGQSVLLKPMSPYERRIVHMTLRDHNEVTTTSKGSGLQRHVVVFLR